ncbi:MAG: DNA repair protein RecO [Pseudomonadota bacterium]
MEFTDQAVVLHARAHGESHAVADLFTEAHGRWAGLVYGGQGRKQTPVLQPGNAVYVTWRGRGGDSLGHFTLELGEARAAAALHDRLALEALTGACATALACLTEREAQTPVYRAMTVVLDAVDDPEVWPALMARWEIGLLAALGFGLALDRCAATGRRDDLVYVSPKSGAAVSADAGAPYADKLFRLPSFLGGVGEAGPEDGADALKLTAYFLETRLLHPVNAELPEARRRLPERLAARARAGLE